jgi:hypothetical protein
LTASSEWLRERERIFQKKDRISVGYVCTLFLDVLKIAILEYH